MRYALVVTLPVRSEAPPQRVSVEEYLRREELATEKHEYIDGFIRPLGQLIAMSGGSFEHGRIAGNCLRALGNRLAGSPCYPIDSSVRVAPSRSARYFYPDVTIICGEPRFDAQDSKRTTLTNPQVTVEVLSGSTEAFDRGEKFNHYRGIETLREYVLVSQHHPLVETFLRQDDGSWSLLPFEGLDAVARLRSLDIDLPLTEVYAGIKFPSPGDFSAPA